MSSTIASSTIASPAVASVAPVITREHWTKLGYSDTVVVGRGDEGIVYELDTDRVLKVFHDTQRPLLSEFLTGINALKQVHVAPAVYYIGLYNYDEEQYTDTDKTEVRIQFVIYKRYSVTMEEYLKSATFERKEAAIAACKDALNGLIAIGQFDYDFRWDNVMIERTCDGVDKVIFVDASIGLYSDDPDTVREIMEYYDFM